MGLLIHYNKINNLGKEIKEIRDFVEKNGRTTLNALNLSEKINTWSMQTNLDSVKTQTELEETHRRIKFLEGLQSQREIEVRDLSEMMNELTVSLEQHVEDVFGKSDPETFYLIKGTRVYEKIDGKPIEEYFKK